GYWRRLRAAPSARACFVTSSFVASSLGSDRMRRASAPIARPNSRGRPTFSPCQNGIRPGTPGAGDTSTRSCVISSTRQLDAPRRNTSPSFVSKTISSSSSPTRPFPFSAPARNTPYRPRSGIVPPFEIVHAPVVHRGHRDDLLRHDVERISRVAEGLDRPGEHPLGDRGAREKVAAELGDDHAGRRLVDAVTGAPDPLHAARDRGGDS